MKLALKIDVDTLRGTREGVPQLVKLLKTHQANATFLFSLGPDHTGRAIKRIFRRGFMRKVSRTSVLKHYGFRTLTYGVLRPGPDIGKSCADIMRMVRDEGFEVGIHTYDHVKWQDYVAIQDSQWAQREMDLAYQRFQEIFKEPAHAHGAAGWQMNRHAYRLTQRLGFEYSSDTRGEFPFMPVIDAEIIRCPQLPTTLPTLDELIGTNNISTDNIAQHLLQMSETPLDTGHVYTLHAELEGMKLMPVFERLITGWKNSGYELVSLHDYQSQLNQNRLPRHNVVTGEIPGRSGTVSLQGSEFLA